ncbi:MAG: ankyrin repeat domain-containing protein [Candidatus Krumholzibacteriota bacterium]|nr:ankyrin repeat domain-containing protein [Candidatus Krumholzibacteriota bacterium]
MRSFIIPLVAAVLILGATVPSVAGDIHAAIEAGDAARVKEILRNVPEAVNERADNTFRELPIHFAATVGNIEIARILLDAGADVDAGDSDNSTALGIAAMRKHHEMVRFLLEQGADVNHRDRKADTPLSFACYRGNDEMVQILIDSGADLYFRNPHGETMLHYACQRGLPALAAHIVANGTDLETQSINGGTPLAYAAGSDNTEIVRMLLENGANPNPPVKKGDVTPLIFTTWRDAVESARILLENGANTETRGYQGKTALMNAADNCSMEMASLLIEHGANVNAVDENGATALVLAAEKGKAGQVEALIKAGAKPELGKDKCGRTALQLAAIGGYSDIARMLITAGADPDSKGACGISPVDLAGYYGNGAVTSLLKAKGARAGSKAIDRSPSSLGRPGKDEATIYFLGHSGWAVRTRNHFLIFDYFKQREDPDKPGLCNGRIDPAELSGEMVSVFASHFHGDHYYPGIFEWKDQIADINYFLGLQPRDSVPPYEFMTERMEKKYGDIKLTTIHSTDAGVGMLVEVDGLTIFHAGDHANGETGLMDEFTEEIDFLAARCPRPDICFMGIRGCSLGQPDQVKEGIEYTLEKLRPMVFIPMHASADGSAYREFIGGISEKFSKTGMVAPENRGDHFIYKKGKIIDPRPFIEDLAYGKKKAECAEKTASGCADR